jgi:DNA-binding transcriptional MerR regulator
VNQIVHHFPRLGISGAMRIFGLTARALRFYEERGLIEARRDRLNNRYYDPIARNRLEWISRLRKADISMAEIHDVLDAESPEARAAAARETLSRRRQHVLAELATVDAMLLEVDGLDASAPARLAR